jgi:Cu+-exporting ATPase
MADDKLSSTAQAGGAASTATQVSPSALSASSAAAAGVAADRFVFIRVEGMHCHKCEVGIKKTLQRLPGVHEVEVDFASGQASVLFDPTLVTINQLVEGVKQAGYKPTGFTQQSDAQV